MEKTWRLIIDAAREPAANMALDEAIMQRMAEEPSGPTLRIYRWTYPCVSIGKFQRLDDIPFLKSSVPIVRRPTGGGSVYHDELGITYSLVFGERSGVMPEGTAASYRHIHEGIAAAVRELGLEAGLYAPVSDTAKAFGSCFALPVKSDVVSHGSKIAGAAQRRRFGIVLHQGEVSLPLDVWRKWSYNNALKIFINCLSKQLQAEFLEGRITDKEERLAEALLMERMEEVTR
ncbi:MAG: lipoate--protein ligase family protein [Candidatus Omnitrophica bacterium]|nr:lipoate--protein ligase family protein [Candidatus Omnitrophota bacterium]